MIGEKRNVKNLWEELEKYSASDYYPFHMPGHKRLPKNEEAVLPLHKRFPNLLNALYRYDITEIDGFDNLHDARGLLRDLQKKAARVYRAEESFFLVNGSTGGILSAVSAVAKEGKKLLMARNCHKSVYHAVLLNRLQAEYLWPGKIEEFEIQGEISAEEIERHLCGRDDICGVVITSPTYEGIISDVGRMAEAAHARGVPLIVDEAHGAHFALSEKAPKGAVECGADIVVGSVHKTLPALTQTALLHVRGKLVDREKLKRYLGIYQSSSPSYLLMASIDACVDFVEAQGEERYERLLAFRRLIDKNAAKLSHIKILPEGERRDPGKLVISAKKAGMSGWALYRILLEKYHLQMEMAAPSYVLGILTGLDTREGVERLLHALEEIDREISEERKERESAAPKEAEDSIAEEIDGGISKKPDRQLIEEGEADDIYSVRPAASGLSIYEAAERGKEWIFPAKAIGRVSGGFLYFYPPGIPLLVPGEVIDEKLISRLEAGGKGDGYLTGMSEDGRVCVLTEDI